MALKIGIVGLPNVGKSTLFNALTRTRAAQAANYPFCTIDPNIGIVEVPDERLKILTDMVKPEKVIPAIVEFVDIAGLVKGASKGEGLGNAFLSHIREVHAICHLVRGFEGGEVIHVEGSVDPKRDREIIEVELALSDLQTVIKRMDKEQGPARTGNKDAKVTLILLEKIKAGLEKGTMASALPLNEEERLQLKDFQLLTGKPMVYGVNVSEAQLSSASPDEWKKKLGLASEAPLVVISAKIEEDLTDLTPEEAKEYLGSLGVTTSGLDRLIAAAFCALGYITYFTAGPEEVRAWTITKGMTAPQAAGVIHSDFEKGFIRAETISYTDFVQFSGELGAKNAGKMRAEGKEYVVADGDVMHFRFSS
ncbi:MAG: GTP-dependent nucleic acid-binding protein EngD [Candidatus Peregrinibacteria bacterium Greene0416_62]|nr:MAG: GTP-dependent nucleic acid-binding protein EngD [Candidatus Peregrinibacteria bacterium Greene0416_62]TSC97308.1 MAG: GTP-dependent nucleic acid-binding protein EngD [Candidatus Peregrinibacteria bacterium Greene1014_49]